MQEKIRTYKDGFGFVESVTFTNSGLSFIDFFCNCVNEEFD